MDKNKTNVPKIRFPGFTDPWEQRKLGEIGEFKNGMNFDKSAMGHGSPFVNLQNIFGRNVVDDSELGLAESTNNQKVEYSLIEGDVLFVRSSVKPEGVGEVALVPKTMVNTTYSGFIIRFRTNYMSDNNFKKYVFATKFVRRQIMAKATSSANTNINQESLSKIGVYLPDNEEQEKIGQFLSNIDNLITLHQRKLNHLQDKKKSLLQKMFPKNGEDCPELRFPGFTDPWEQRKLGEISDSFEYGLNAAATEFDGVNKYIRITDIDDESRRFLETDLTSPNVDLSNADNYKLKSGDILFTRTGASVGKSYIYKEYDGLVYYAGFLIRARIKPEYDAEFVFQSTLTNKYNKYIRITSQRSGQPGVNAQEYAEFKLRVPEYDEQSKIGLFLKQLDNLITLHQRKLNHLQEQKKALLQQMFV
ncbi:restriction endonuclease subunit S [Clostridium sp.]|uniref:restriction endonuclease subunit S n=1 Tax=Clostridium sp. TaxID=1506 RepID=UPI002FDE8CF7